jgi:Protein kinase domain/PH domain
LFQDLLLANDFHMRLTDFGTAKKIGTSNQLVRSSFVGTANYVPPELIDGDNCSPASDLWALGCVLYQFLVGRAAFAGRSEHLIFQQIREVRIEFPKRMAKQARDLICRLLDRDAMKRPNFEAIRRHPWFDGFDWADLPLQTPPTLRAPAEPLLGDDAGLSSCRLARSDNTSDAGSAADSLDTVVLCAPSAEPEPKPKGGCSSKHRGSSFNGVGAPSRAVQVGATGPTRCDSGGRPASERPMHGGGASPQSSSSSSSSIASLLDTPPGSPKQLLRLFGEAPKAPADSGGLTMGDLHAKNRPTSHSSPSSSGCDASSSAAAAVASSAAMAPPDKLLDLTPLDVDERWQRFLLTDEHVVFHGLIAKRTHVRTRRRELLLTDRPRLLYIDPDTLVVRGQIPFSAELEATRAPSSRRHFAVATPARSYLLEALNKTSSDWVNAIRSAQQLFFASHRSSRRRGFSGKT